MENKERKAKSEKRKAIPYGKQHVTQSDIDAVVEVLKSDYLTQGPKVQEFEEAFANYVGSNYAVAVANGTAALHLNCLALGVQPGDKVITTPITFAASANCVRYCGGEVVFADIDPETYLLDIEEVRKLLQADSKNEIKGIIPVNFAGRVVDMEVFRALADEYGCWIIEDACHSPGGYFVNSNDEQVKAGSGRYADLAIFSFHPVKHIAAGEGGMITTNDPKLYEKLKELRTHGITKDSDKFQNPIELAIGSANSEKQTAHRSPLTAYPNWYMEMQSLGYNYRMPDINCALGLSQLQRAEEGLQKRQKMAARYHKAFKDIPQITDRNYESAKSEKQKAKSEKRIANSEKRKAANGHAHHLYVIETEDRLGLYNHLREKKIYAQIHYIPCHLMPYYQEQGWDKSDLPIAEKYYKGCISLPMYPTLSETEQQFVVETILDFYKQ